MYRERRPYLAIALILLLLTPVAWGAPLLRAGLLPLFGLSEVSILSGIATLWQGEEQALAVLIVVLALVAPMAKLIALIAILLSRAPVRLMPAVEVLGKLAMADVFLIAVYVTLAKGISVGRVETAWGLWLFSFCVLAALALSVAVRHHIDRATEVSQH